MLTSIYRYAAWGLAALALAGAIYGKGFLSGDDHGQGVVRAADAKAQAVIYKRFEWNVKNGQKLAGQLAATEAKAQPIAKKANKEISDDTHPIVAAPGAGTPLPQLTVTAVSLWDGKWAGIELSGGSAAGLDAAAAGLPASDAKSASGFDIRDALYSNALDADACWTDIRYYQALRQYELDRAARAGADGHH